MSNPNEVLDRIRQGRTWSFPGGIHPPEMKKQSNQKPIRALHLPKYFYVPLVQHAGSAGELIVSQGQKVLKGQPLTRGDHYRQLPVHSPTSGTVIAIQPYVSCHPSGLSELTVVIETDGQDEWIARQPIDDFLHLTSDQIIEKVYQAGIAGLGGAVFPTSSKLHYADKRCQLLIINGAECEPYITCDDRLMQEHAAELIEGIRILRYVLRPEAVVIAIEDNKPKAIQAVRKALKGANDIILRVIPTKYPSGASDQLVQILTGLEIPYGKRSIEMGIVMHNVGTAVAVKRAVIDDEPLIERVVTLTGDKIRNKGNVWARLGTPIIHLLEQVDYQADERFPVFLGGPMMGFILPSLQAPVTKTANCIIAPDHFEYAPPQPERNCIRCSSCSDACPVGLLPQQLYWFARAEEHEKSKAYHLDACIECGVCAYVCPSYIPLIQYFRQEKAKLAEIDEKAKKAEEAKQRFEAREARLNKEKEARTARIQQAAEKRREEVANSQGEDPVKAALARLKAKKADSGETETPKIVANANGEPDNRDLMAQRRARRLAKQAEQTAQQAVSSAPNSAIAAEIAENPAAADMPKNSVMSDTTVQDTDPRKAAVAAALARAKAKKAAQQAVSSAPNSATSAELAENPAAPDMSENSVTADTSVQDADPRKAAVSAISAEIAENPAEADITENSVTADTTEQNTDPRKAAVAAALARAKAKKAAQQAVSSAPNSAISAEIAENPVAADMPKNSVTADTSVQDADPRKAAVAAALARAKAKKAAQQAVSSAPNSAISAELAENPAAADITENSVTADTSVQNADPRKAAVAAALARAKAKKAARQAVSSVPNSAISPEIEENPAAADITENSVTADTSVQNADPRKAAVAAALARAKAKKAAQQAVSSVPNSAISPEIEENPAAANVKPNSPIT
ncbi:electron transport complex subunit RsxC [Muribacter muris]|uniref:Ion-translocating oxidoreductase complex subunit C n=1 Tax=Muribacter muris TaxID=67855 RepID=A0A4Y9K393_9PAST|nr:electron transport complex subunit RsxC [Muribacter muris]MBF0827813.1 electron transport complex subunit RsxC [Muribacter muris]TFV11165.1 electron transport complex subunit RsxC [Muribacter muris]